MVNLVSEWKDLSNGEQYQYVATYEGVEYWLPNDESLTIRCVKRKMPDDEDIEQDTDFYEMDDFEASDSDYRMVEHLGKLVCKFESFRVGDRVKITHEETVWGKEGGRLVGVEYDPHDKQGSLKHELNAAEANKRLISGNFICYLIEVDDKIPDNLRQIFPTNRLAFFKHHAPRKIS
ncbi:MAG: hypothetical protein C0610_16645 [Desulfobacteraceae bacterium]|nr:MAG: hypothetical protein C0610_16645 [Desulfobacteraceae bacterium]